MLVRYMASREPAQKACRPRAQLDIVFERWSAYVVAVVLSVMIVGASARVAIRPPLTSVWKTLTAGWVLDVFAVWNAIRLRRDHLRSSCSQHLGKRTIPYK